MSLQTPQHTASTTVHHGQFVLPQPPRGPLGILVQRAPGIEAPGLLWPMALRNLARHLDDLAASQQQLLGELQQQLAHSDSGVATEPRVRLKADLQTSAQISCWLAAVQEELQLTAARLAAGLLPLDLRECAEAAAARCPQWHPQVVGEAGRAVWGDPAALLDLLDACLLAVAERTQGTGSLAVWVDGHAVPPSVTVRGRGSLTEDLDPRTIQRVRQAAARAGVRVLPDEALPGCAGLLLRLPPAAIDS
jgi:hypothetical protein